MANIEERNGKKRVRWRGLDGREHSRACPDATTAKCVRREVEQALAEGREWAPHQAGQEPDLEVMLEAYIRECARIYQRRTTIRQARAMDLFVRFLRQKSGPKTRLTAAILNRSLLAEYYESLETGGLHGRPRALETRKRLVETVQLVWQWLSEEDDFHRFVPPPRKLRMRRSPTNPTVAPTFEEMDSCVNAASGWRQDLALLMRFTGLRVSQVMGLLWHDLDLPRAEMTVRGELGKSLQERRGRRIPISRHMAEILSSWERTREFVIVPGPQCGPDRDRVARAKQMGHAWRRAGVRREVWRQPQHAFRKGFVSGLRRLGADPDAVEVLVGHSLGLRGVYTDPDALPLRKAVDLIPPLHCEHRRESETDTGKARFEGGQFEGNDSPVRVVTLDGEWWEHRGRRSRVCPERVPRQGRPRKNVVSLAAYKKGGEPAGDRTRDPQIKRVSGGRKSQ